jgi:steroid delta-isomerase-like uncharacterized protein
VRRRESEADRARAGEDRRTVLLALPFAALALGMPAAAAAAAAPADVDPRQRVRLWYEAFATKRPALLDDLLAPGWVDIPSPPGERAGPDAAKKTLVLLTTAFPDFDIRIEDIIADGDKVVVRSRITGTQKLAFAGIPARGGRLDIQAIDIHEFKAGRVVRTWHTEDWMTGLRQLGAGPR